MMRLLLLIFWIIPTIYCSSQISGEIDYKVETQLVFNDKDGISTLKFNQKEGLYRYANFPKEDTFIETSSSSMIAKTGDEHGHPIYTNLPENRVQLKHKIVNHICIISDTIINIDWKILPQTKEILGFKCSKAFGVFGGRTYEVWFTLEIPVSLGPHRLSGLPGLILKAKSKDSVISFSVINIKLNSATIIQPLEEFISAPVYSYNKYLNVRKKIYRNTKIRMESEIGTTWDPVDNQKDWQVFKNYF